MAISLHIFHSLSSIQAYCIIFKLYIFLLFQHGADVMSLDVDGNFPADHAPAGSYSQVLIQNHIKDKGSLSCTSGL